MKSKTSEVLQIGTAADPVRLSFPVLDKPKAFQAGQEEKFGAAFLLDPSNKTHAALIAKLKSEIKKLALVAYDGKLPGDLKVCLTNNVNPDGTQKKAYSGYDGMYYLTANNGNRPVIVNRERNLLAYGDEGFPYAGCYVIGTITLWAQNNKFGKRINANLRGVQFVRDGESFGRPSINVEDEFEAIEDSDVRPAITSEDDIAF
jgi:hypothetical protein